MARAKSKFVKVLLESFVTKHQVILIKLRTLEPLEVLRYDPMLQAPCLYREVKKISSHKRQRKGLPPAPSASGPLVDEPDWSYPDGTPGMLNKSQSQRYLRDQEFGRSMVREFAQLKAMKQMGSQSSKSLEEAESVDKQYKNK